ncbi:hypothetical protein [Natrinema soli]|uniref:Uncharacterized protein n=1 Tax=Natrinema soli TaxID=1930624 RepID=A0ABD5SLZ5_9EURY|nr:hypothetical protein [Natrinema soli]
MFGGAFVRERTEFEMLDELVAASPSEAGSVAELETVSHGEWNEYVAKNTAFDDEESFVLAARDHWVTKWVGLVRTGFLFHLFRVSASSRRITTALQ